MCNVIHPPIISREHAYATVMRKLPIFSSEENLKRVFGFPPKLHRGGREKCKNFYEKQVQLSVSANLKKKKV